MPVGGFYGFKSKTVVSTGGASPTQAVQGSREDLRFAVAAAGTIPAPTVFYRLQEDAGFQRLDTSGNGYSLSDSGTVTVSTGTGSSGTCAVWDGTSHQYLNFADNAAFSGGAQDKTFTVWVNVSAIPASFDRCVFSKGKLSGNREYRMTLKTTGFFSFTVYDSTGTAYTATDTAVDMNLYLSQWVMVHCYIDDAGKGIGISVNLNAITPAIMGSNSVRDSTDDFRMGIIDNTSATGSSRALWSGSIDAFAMWNGTLLSETELTNVYNSGTATEYYNSAWQGQASGSATYYPVFVLGVDNIDSTDPVFYIP